MPLPLETCSKGSIRGKVVYGIARGMYRYNVAGELSSHRQDESFAAAVAASASATSLGQA